MMNLDGFALRPAIPGIWHTIGQYATRANWDKFAQWDLRSSCSTGGSRGSLIVIARPFTFLLTFGFLISLFSLFFAFFFLNCIFLLLGSSCCISCSLLPSSKWTDVLVDEVFVCVDHGNSIWFEVSSGDAEHSGPHQVCPTEQELFHVLLYENVNQTFIDWRLLLVLTRLLKRQVSKENVKRGL